jgi:hypothetical protein
MKRIELAVGHPVTVEVNAYGQWLNFPAKPGEFSEEQISRFKRYNADFGEFYDELEDYLYEKHLEKYHDTSLEDLEDNDGSENAMSERHDWYLQQRRNEM